MNHFIFRMSSNIIVTYLLMQFKIPFKKIIINYFLIKTAISIIHTLFFFFAIFLVLCEILF